MAIASTRICVFCGGPPNAKTREHVVPTWLLELTGDPTRTVTHGYDFMRRRPIRFSWSNFVAPACEACNQKYSDLEDRAKLSVEALWCREGLSVGAYVELLDWLDKIRIGAWLALHMIEKNPVEIEPKFHISSRMGTKDRMVAVYVFDSDNKGINLLGCDSQIFREMPSCFGLRVNDLLLLNVSSDFFCSKGCGLPYPQSMNQLMGGEGSGRLELSGVGWKSEVSHPLSKLSLPKPVVWLYQPIKLPVAKSLFAGGFYGHTDNADPRLVERTLHGESRQGALFRQFKDSVEVIADPLAVIEFDNVTGDECATQGAIAASVYKAQSELFKRVAYKWRASPKGKRHFEDYRKAKVAECMAIAAHYEDLGRRKDE
jgi:hypothetical protein